MEKLIYVGAVVFFVIIVIVALALTIAKLYHRSSKSYAFVRTGAGGAKVIKDGGALIFPILHEVVKVNMNTIKLEVKKHEKEALITLDRMRVDVSAEFYVRVKQTEESIAVAAQTLGSKTMNPAELKILVEGKFVDALRSVASSMTMKDLHEKRVDFVQKVQHAVTSDLEKNGLELESVSLTSFDQTKREFFNVDNAFDAEGLTQLTQEIEQRKKIRNDIEQDNRLQIAQKNLATEREQLIVSQELEKAKAETAKFIALQKATQDAEVAKFEASTTQESATARIEAERKTEQAQIIKNREIKTAEIEAERLLQEKSIEKDLALKEATIKQQKQLELAEQEKNIALAKKSEDQAAAKASAEKARAEQVRATQEVTTIEQVAEAERRQRIEVLNAEAAAKKESVKIVVVAEAEAEAADKRATTLVKAANAQAEADEIKAKGIKAIYVAEAEGKSLLNEAANKQSPESMRLTIQTQLINKLPEIIRESTKPLENIESIRIVDMGQSNLSSLSQSGEDGGQSSNPSLPDQVVNAALRHRTAAPLVDNLLSSVGIKSTDMAGSLSNLLDVGNKKEEK